MGLFSGARRGVEQVEERGTYIAPSFPYYGGNAYAPVVTPATAAQSVAIRSTADLIASLASELPINVYTIRGRRREEVQVPDSLQDPGGDDTGRQDWGYRLLWSWLLTGNAFGTVVDQAGRTLQTVDLVNPDAVSPTIVDGEVHWYVSGRRVTNNFKFLHWRVNPVPGRLMGLSPVEHHAATIGVSLATTRFGRDFFTDGAHPSGMLTNEADLNDQEAATAKARFMLVQGTREPVVLGKGWKWEDIQISPEESQFLQTRSMSEADCARIFGPGFAEILGYETGQKMTYSNVVERRQDLLVLGMNKWFSRYERILTKFTPPNQWVEINRDALLQATTKQRYEAHASALEAGWKTINEVREVENLPPLASTASDPQEARAIAELIQKIYLGVGVVLTAEEARNIANRAGAGLVGNLPKPTEG